MRRALQLAELGCKKAYPNPMVGAVIVHDNKIIGEGWHKQYGEAHAEVNAVQAVNDKNLLQEATMYVTLEPCSHHGKTPPCSDLIIEKKIKRVVIACVDSYAEVSGRGIAKLKQAGIQVDVGVCEEAAKELNKRFFTFHEKKRPYIVLKWAESRDGFIDKERSSETREINWITQPETKVVVHAMRAKEHGILVGWKTIAKDNPSLTVRAVSGISPTRVILDPHCNCPLDSAVFKDDVTTLLLCKQNRYASIPENSEVIELSDYSLTNCMAALHAKQLLSVIIEGGSYTLQAFIDAGLWDEAYRFIGTPNFERGTPAPKIEKAPVAHTEQMGKDQVIHYKQS